MKIWMTILTRGLLFSLIWWLLTDASLASWWIGVPAVSLAVIVSIALVPPMKFVWLGAIRFIPFFLARSLLGGVDVARRVFVARLPIAPDLFEYPLRLPPGLARVFMANIVSLLPGTLSAGVDQSILKIHVLDNRSDFKAEIEAVEQGVARMFAVPLNIATEGARDEKI